MIYLAGDSERGVCKIGWTSDFAQRLRILEQSYPFEFDVKLQKFGGIEDEAKILSELVGHKIKGEWFTLCEATLSFFNEYNAESSSDLEFCVKILEGIPGFLLSHRLKKCPVPVFKMKSIRRKSGANYTSNDVKSLAAYLRSVCE